MQEFDVEAFDSVHVVVVNDLYTCTCDFDALPDNRHVLVIVCVCACVWSDADKQWSCMTSKDSDVISKTSQETSVFVEIGRLMAGDTFVSVPFYIVRQKKYPLKFFAIFLATARNFYMKFHIFITHSSSRKIAKQHCIIFNYDKVIIISCVTK